MKVRIAITVVLLVLVVVFLLQNAAIVELRLWFWQLSVPRSLLVVMMLAIGMVVGWFCRSFYRITRQSRKP